MNCSELATLIEQQLPDSTALEQAHMLLLLLADETAGERLNGGAEFAAVWTEHRMRLQAALDQHEAMSIELKELTNSDPTEFTAAQTWVLVRAIKIQSQLLKLFAGSMFTVHN